MKRKVEKAPALTADELSKLKRAYWEPEFWFGYHRGLNRLRYGKIFGNVDEHRSWISIPDNLEDEPSVERIARGIGYRTGYAGIQFDGAVDKIREFMKYLQGKYGVEDM